VAGRLTDMDSAFDTAMLPEALGACACCVRESLDAAGVSLDCRPVVDETNAEDAWHSR